MKKGYIQSLVCCAAILFATTTSHALVQPQGATEQPGSGSVGGTIDPEVPPNFLSLRLDASADTTEATGILYWQIVQERELAYDVAGYGADPQNALFAVTINIGQDDSASFFNQYCNLFDDTTCRYVLPIDTSTELDSVQESMAWFAFDVDLSTNDSQVTILGNLKTELMKCLRTTLGCLNMALRGYATGLPGWSQHCGHMHVRNGFLRGSRI